MSLAYKLWKIGSVLNENDIKKALKSDTESKDGKEFNYVNVNFIIENEEIKGIEVNENAISKEKMFFSKKIGGSGSGMYYLYPNLVIKDIKKGKEIEENEKKIYQLKNTIEKSVLKFCNDKIKNKVKLIIKKFEDIKEYIYKAKLTIFNEIKKNKENDIADKLEEKLNMENSNENFKKIEKEINTLSKEIKNIAKNINSLSKEIDKNKITDWDSKILNMCKQTLQKEYSDYWFWFSINGKTFYELMPEIWDNWYKCPVIKNNNAKEGYDAFTNQEAEIGYKPEIKIFSYDNYHDSLNFRINDNLPLSFESARNIKFSWMYILEDLVFYYKGLEYLIIPNLISDNPDILKTILERFRRANKKTGINKTILESLQDQERKLENDIKKLGKKKILKEINQKLEELKKQKETVSAEIEKIDLCMIQKIEDEINEVGDLKDSITVDYIFASINRTNLSFEIKGSIEDIVPSHVRNIVTLMRREGCQINDLVTLKKRDREKTYLQDFFNRNELYFALNRSSRNNANAILAERLFLARLLLTNEKIKKEDLLRRFEINREFNYHKKKRLTKDGIKEWINFPDSFIKYENNIMNFLNKLNKIKE